jgi:transcriptional regulator with XRE-family HTH domain
MDDLSGRSGVSRSTLSRIERGEVHPTATVLNQVCSAYGLTLSRLFSEVEDGPPGLVRVAEQPVWTDPASGFVRRSVSPPHPGLRAEVVAGELPPGAVIDYDRPPVHGLEQHVWVQEGTLALTTDGAEHLLGPGDCLRFRVTGPTRFRSPGAGAVRYLVVAVLP